MELLTLREQSKIKKFPQDTLRNYRQQRTRKDSSSSNSSTVSSQQQITESKQEKKLQYYETLCIPEIAQRSRFQGVENYIKDVYINQYQCKKPVNFCSQKYKQNLKKITQEQQLGYKQLLQSINQSHISLKQVKRGKSLYEQKEIQNSSREQSLPIFEDIKIRQNLEQYLDYKVQDYSISKRSKTRNNKSVSIQQDYQNNFTEAVNHKINPSTISDQKSSPIKSSRRNISYNPYQDINQNKFQKAKHLEKQFDFPLNPAYFHSSVIKTQRKLQSIDLFCQEKSVSITKKQNIDTQIQKVQNEHKYWQKQFNHIIKGYKDADFDSGIVKFIKDLKLSNISEAETQLITSPEINNDEIGRKVTGIIQKYIHQEKIQKHQTRITLRNKSVQSCQFLSDLLNHNDNFKKEQFDHYQQNQQIQQKDQLLQSQNQEENSLHKKYNQNQYLTNRRQSTLVTSDQQKDLLDVSNHQSQNQLGYQLQRKRQSIIEQHDKSVSKIKQDLNFMVKNLDDVSRVQTNKKKSCNQEKQEQLAKYFDKSNLPIARLIKTTEKIQQKRKNMNTQLRKILARQDLDRPLLFKEKIETFLESDSNFQLFNSSILTEQSLSHHRNQSVMSYNELRSSITRNDLQKQIQDKKLERIRKNNQQREIYQKILKEVCTRRKGINDIDVQSEQIRFINLLKIILEAGWIIDEHSFVEILELTGIKDIYDEYLSQIHQQEREGLSIIDERVKIILNTAKFASNLFEFNDINFIQN